MPPLRSLIPATVVASCVVASIACSTNSQDESPAAVVQSSVTPAPVPGFPTCQTLGYAFGCLINVEFGSTCVVNGITVRITPSAVFQAFDWTATGPINAVLVGPNHLELDANLYTYGGGGSTGDNGLSSVDNVLFEIRFCASGDAGVVDAGPDAAPDAQPDAQPDASADASSDAPADAKNDRGQSTW